jgi:hypothetical protein
MSDSWSPIKIDSSRAISKSLAALRIRPGLGFRQSQTSFEKELESLGVWGQ